MSSILIDTDHIELIELRHQTHYWRAQHAWILRMNPITIRFGENAIVVNKKEPKAMAEDDIQTFPV